MSWDFFAGWVACWLYLQVISPWIKKIRADKSTDSPCS